MKINGGGKLKGLGCEFNPEDGGVFISEKEKDFGEKFKDATVAVTNTMPGVIAYKAIAETDFIKSGKAAIVGEAIVNSVKNLPNTIASAGKAVAAAPANALNNLFHQDAPVVAYAAAKVAAEVNEAVRAQHKNDLMVSECDKAQDA